MKWTEGGLVVEEGSSLVGKDRCTLYATACCGPIIISTRCKSPFPCVLVSHGYW